MNAGALRIGRDRVALEAARRVNLQRRGELYDVGLLLLEWARAVQRGDPDGASFLGQAKAAALEATVRR